MDSQQYAIVKLLGAIAAPFIVIILIAAAFAAVGRCEKILREIADTLNRAERDREPKPGAPPADQKFIK